VSPCALVASGQLLHRDVMVGDLKRVQGLIKAHPGAVNTSDPYGRCSTAHRFLFFFLILQNER